MPLLIGALIDTRYRLVALLGRGARSEVYLAEQAIGSSSRQVALQVLRTEDDDPEAAARFRRQCSLLSMLTHPSTVRLYDFGQTPDGDLYRVLERIEGESLHDRIARGPIPPAGAVHLVGQLCGALHEVHDKGFVHGDLTPANIVLTRRAGVDDHVKLFGFEGATRFEPPPLVGVQHYLSPEHIAGEALDARSDLYALGLITYELLAGRRPFEAMTSLSSVLQQLTAPPPPLARLSTGAPAPLALEAAVMWALARNRDERPPSAHAFFEALTRGLG